MPQPLLTIRRAAPADAATLAPFAAAAFWDTYRDIDDADDIASYVAKHLTAEELSRVMQQPGSTTLVAETAQDVAGYAILTWSEAPPCVAGERPIELARLYLGQAFIGQGHGLRLMQALHQEAAAQGARTMWLGVYDRNLRAVRFYERFGFAKVGGKEFLFGGKVYIDPIYAAPVLT